MKAGQTSEISPSAVLGNIFIFTLAGHEAMANTFVYAIVLLACCPTFQKALQADLDHILGDRPRSDWSYKTDFPKLLNGYIGAILNETLRHYPPLPILPKTTKAPRHLKIGGRSYLVPANTDCMIHSSATHNHPKYWPVADSNIYDGIPPSPMSSFDPSIWLKDNSGGSPLIPKPGSYIPFAEGYRKCNGKRFTQIEFCAVVATIFKEWSVELAVEGDQTSEGYAAAKRNAELQLSSIELVMALKMINNVPVRLVPRGEEKWMT